MSNKEAFLFGLILGMIFTIGACLGTLIKIVYFT